MTAQHELEDSRRGGSLAMRRHPSLHRFLLWTGCLDLGPCLIDGGLEPLEYVRPRDVLGLRVVPRKLVHDLFKKREKFSARHGMSLVSSVEAVEATRRFVHSSRGYALRHLHVVLDLRKDVRAPSVRLPEPLKP